MEINLYFDFSEKTPESKPLYSFPCSINSNPSVPKASVTSGTQIKEQHQKDLFLDSPTI